MASKCTACGKRIATLQEVTTIVSSAVRGMWSFVRENGAAIVKLATILAANSIVGIAAGPLNVNKLPCPHCGAVERWVDDDE
jgi:predicted RNA-binding Zn-ribbon protein involved in translation (DUF1610 family)